MFSASTGTRAVAFSLAFYVYLGPSSFLHKGAFWLLCPWYRLKNCLDSLWFSPGYAFYTIHFSATPYIVQNLSCIYLQIGRATCQRWEPFKLLSNVIKCVPWLILWAQIGFCAESKIWNMSQWLNGTGMLNEFGICFVKCGSRRTDGLRSSGSAWNSHYSDDVTCHVEWVVMLQNYGQSKANNKVHKPTERACDSTERFHY